MSTCIRQSGAFFLIHVFHSRGHQFGVVRDPRIGLEEGCGIDSDSVIRIDRDARGWSPGHRRTVREALRTPFLDAGELAPGAPLQRGFRGDFIGLFVQVLGLPFSALLLCRKRFGHCRVQG